MLLTIKCLLFGILAFFAMQGFLDVLGIAKSIPSPGAIITGILSIPNYLMIESLNDNSNTSNTGPR